MLKRFSYVMHSQPFLFASILLGSGKTALVASLIGDLKTSMTTLDSQETSSLDVKGRLAYVAQVISSVLSPAAAIVSSFSFRPRGS